MTVSQGFLALVNPEVTSIRARQTDIDEDAHVNWFVGYAPEPESEPYGRVVFGTLHAAANNGIADVSVASLMLYEESAEPGDDFETVLTESHALESLYDVARIAFRSICALTGIDVEVPAKAPEPDLSVLRRTDDESDDEAPAEDSLAERDEEANTGDTEEPAGN